MRIKSKEYKYTEISYDKGYGLFIHQPKIRHREHVDLIFISEKEIKIFIKALQKELQ